ncbi:phenylalanyl-tRNA synthetase [Auriscalpium vulgare]|uniref:Phenylalanyl-tRNA synthetase n=1 Tax=Auriscalpium vulgare TaxID=40419 RepID=A0ACB8SC77_9AGAM|nr:phenylalanyl-tRNA synthetase [Auriscalpium vulgare]
MATKVLQFSRVRSSAWRPLLRRHTSTAAPTPSEIPVLGTVYPADAYTNITPTIAAKLTRRLHAQDGHPIATLRGLIESHFPDYAHLSSLSPIVTPHQNFDSLSFPADHPGRAKTDSYYINKDYMLRTHTSAHEVDVFTSGSERWLLTADVYRRDEIDASHYPVFHQTEGAKIFQTDAASLEAVEEDSRRLERELAQSNIVIEDVPHLSSTNPAQSVHNPRHSEIAAKNLKLSLNSLMYTLFGGVAGATKEDPLRVRWIEAFFPFTSPSYEVEVFFRGKWLEILGCGVVAQPTLDRSNVVNKMGWAFGLGLERIAMVLYSIPDIRLFWSEDERFLSQFSQGKINTFKPYSKYPASYRDVSLWLPSDGLHDNDVYDLVRDVAGDLVEDVAIIDRFTHPKTERQSMTVRTNFRSMDRSLVKDEVNELQAQVQSRLKEQFRVEIR